MGNRDRRQNEPAASAQFHLDEILEEARVLRQKKEQENPLPAPVPEKRELQEEAPKAVTVQESKPEPAEEGRTVEVRAVKRPVVREQREEQPDTLDGQIAFDLFAEQPPEEAEAVNTVWVEQYKEARKKKVSGFVLEGDEEENAPEEELPPPPPPVEEITDYNGPDDAYSIRMDLSIKIRQLSMRMVFTVLIEAALLYLAIGTLGFGVPSFISPAGAPYIFLIVNASLMALLIFINAGTVVGGFGALLRLKPDGDGAAAIAAAAALIQNIALFAMTDQVAAGKVHCYTAVAGMAILFNAIGKRMILTRVRHNFPLISTTGDKYAVLTVEDEKTAEVFGRGIILGAPEIAYANRTRFLSGYLECSYTEDPGDHNAQIIAPIGAIGAAVAAIGALIVSRDGAAAVAAFGAAACICVPVTSLIAANLPLQKCAKALAQKGAVLTGYAAAKQYSEVNAVVVDAAELFDQKSIVLHGIKPFRGQRIDDAIVDAAAMICAAGGPLSDIFRGVIEGRMDILPPVDTLVYEQEMGLSGWVSGRRVLVGNRRLMENHGIDLPSQDFEQKFLREQRCLVYLSVAGVLAAVFVVTYLGDPEIAAQLKKMNKNGVSLVVRTSDPNITPELIGRCFSVPKGMVKILSAASGKLVEELHEEPEESALALLATKGKTWQLLRLINAAIGIKANAMLAVGLQTVGAVLGIGVVLFLALYQGLSLIGPMQILIYQAFWVVAVLLATAYKRI